MEAIFLVDIQAALFPTTRFPLHIGQRVSWSAGLPWMRWREGLLKFPPGP